MPSAGKPSAAAVKVAKVNIRTVSEETNFATEEGMLDALETFRIKHAIPIYLLIQLLCEKKASYVSAGVDDPYCNFFARLNRNKAVSIIMKEADSVFEFDVPTSALAGRLPGHMGSGLAEPKDASAFTSWPNKSRDKFLAKHGETS